MKKLFAIFLSVSAFTCLAQDISLSSSNARQKTLTLTNNLGLPEVKQLNGVSYLDFSTLSKVQLMDVAAPALSVFRESVTVSSPDAVQVNVVPGSFTEYTNVNVLPSKGSLKRNVNPNDVPYTFGAVYQQNKFYPENMVTVSSPFTFRNKMGVNVSFVPYQYNPVTKVLRVYHSISATIGSETATSNDLEIRENDAFQALYSQLFLDESGYSPISDLGDMLVITPATYQNLLTNFVNWKNESGIKTNVVTLAQTGSSPTAIKAYIENYYNQNPNLAYVLLIGDHQNVPTYSYGTSGAEEEFYSDSFYGQLVGDDFYPELMVGRLSGTINQMPRILNKIINYETQPLAGTWMTNAVGIGSDEGAGYGDEGQADYEHLRAIGDQLMDFGYNTIYEFYQNYQGGGDEWGDPTPDMISAAINEGVGLLNYTGHGATQIMSTGNYANVHVNQLTNTGKNPFVVSVACNNGTFVGATSLCEAFLSASQGDNPTGAIAACGSSILMAWAEPMQTQDEMANLITKSNPSYTLNTLGGLFFNGQLSMLEAYGNSPTAIEVMQTWIMFGDPSVSFRSAEFQEITANHELEVPAAGTTVTVTSNTESAFAVLSQNNQILASALITNGSAALDVPTLSDYSNLKITLTKPNTKPYRGTITVAAPLSIDDQINDEIAVYPNPVKDVLTVRLGRSNSNVAVIISDLNGRVVLERKLTNTTEQSLDVSMLSTGMYVAKLMSERATKVVKLTVQ